MSDIKKALAKVVPIKKKGKTLLLEFDGMPHLWRWLERQSAGLQCSKTTYVKTLIQLDLDKRGKE